MSHAHYFSTGESPVLRIGGGGGRVRKKTILELSKGWYRKKEEHF
jgi:hypothetical protein